MASSINASTSGAGGVITTADSSGVLNIQTAGTNAVTVNASQNVGIGTTPTVKLHTYVENAGTPTTSGSATTGVSARFQNSSVNFDIGTYSSGECFIQPRLIGNNATNFDSILNPNGGNVQIGGTTPAPLGKLSMYWDSSTQSGLVCKTTSATFNGSPIIFQNSSGGTSGFIGQTTSSISYNTSSDYRLKENIVPMTGALDKVALLKPVTYKWKIDGSSGEGFIAHELQAVVPNAVVGEKDAVDEEGNIKPQGIDTSFLVATLTAAIQEQQTIINDLKARVETLEAK